MEAALPGKSHTRAPSAARTAVVWGEASKASKMTESKLPLRIEVSRKSQIYLRYLSWIMLGSPCIIFHSQNKSSVLRFHVEDEWLLLDCSERFNQQGPVKVALIESTTGDEGLAQGG